MGHVGKSGRMNTKPEPRFDIDYAYGRQAELQIGDLLQWIASGNGRVEVKRKRILDLDFYVETHCDKGRTGHYTPSGISVTEAHVWAFVLGETGMSVLIPTEDLHAVLDDPSVQDKEQPRGAYPTKGKLVNIAVLLYRYQQRHAKPETVPEQKPVGEKSAITAADIDWGFK